jgi:hypothetical protein
MLASMEIILEVTLVLSAPENPELDEDEDVVELEKRLELPFTPYENLDLLLPGASEVLAEADEDELQAMAEWIVISPELASGIFHISRVAFDVEAGRFLAQNDSINTEDATPSDIENFAAHLQSAFGFERRALEESRDTPASTKAPASK